MISVEEYISLNGSYVLDGFGITISFSRRIYDRFLRSGGIERRGKFFIIRGKSLYKIYRYRDDERLLLLASSVRDDNTGRIIDFNKPVGLYYRVFIRDPFKIKLRFKAWRKYTGIICIGNSCTRIRWLIRIPTYERYSILFLCHPEDIERTEDNKITYPIDNIIAKYREKHNYTKERLAVTVAPLFKKDAIILDRILQGKLEEHQNTKDKLII